MQCMYIQYIPDALTMLFLQVKDKLHLSYNDCVFYSCVWNVRLL
jgi:hypothetical protein